MSFARLAAFPAGTAIFQFDEPSCGIDLQARAEIHDLIERLAKAGKAVHFVSSELPEVIRLADRVLVMREVRISAILGAATLVAGRSPSLARCRRRRPAGSSAAC